MSNISSWILEKFKRRRYAQTCPSEYPFWEELLTSNKISLWSDALFSPRRESLYRRRLTLSGVLRNIIMIVSRVTDDHNEKYILIHFIYSNYIINKIFLVRPPRFTKRLMTPSTIKTQLHFSDSMKLKRRWNYSNTYFASREILSSPESRISRGGHKSHLESGAAAFSPYRIVNREDGVASTFRF